MDSQSKHNTMNKRCRTVIDARPSPSRCFRLFQMRVWARRATPAFAAAYVSRFMVDAKLAIGFLQLDGSHSLLLLILPGILVREPEGRGRAVSWVFKHAHRDGPELAVVWVSRE